jgi:hypothetical protein
MIVLARPPSPACLRRCSAIRRAVFSASPDGSAGASGFVGGLGAFGWVAIDATVLAKVVAINTSSNPVPIVFSF